MRLRFVHLSVVRLARLHGSAAPWLGSASPRFMVLVLVVRVSVLAFCDHSFTVSVLSVFCVLLVWISLCVVRFSSETQLLHK